MHLNVYHSSDEAVRAVADLFVKTAEDAIAQKGLCRVVLSGGNSPKSLYELLASAAYRDKIDWSKVYFFFGDERYVPADDPAYNGLMAKKALFEPLNIAQENIFYIDTAVKAGEAASKYARTILSQFNDDPLRFDLVLLGLGDDAHTASLFPNTKVLYEKSALVKDVYVDKLKAERITLTAALINEAAVIAFLVFGAGKAEAVKNVLHGTGDIDKYPAQLISPEDGELYWYLDEPAAAQLPGR